MSIYSIDKKYSTYDIYRASDDSVIIYNMKNFEGNSTVLDEGIYDSDYGIGQNILNNVKSLVIPFNYLVYVISNNDKIYYIAGYKEITDLDNYLQINKGKLCDRSCGIGVGRLNNRLNNNGIKKIYIDRITNKSVIFCDVYNSMCYSRDPGIYTLPSFLYLKIRYINLNPELIDSVTLYTDINLEEPLQTIKSELYKNVYEVEFPRIIRAVQVLTKNWKLNCMINYLKLCKLLIIING